MRVRQVALASYTCLGAGLAFASVLAHGIETWRVDPELSFGFLALPAAAGIIALRLRQLVAVADRGPRIGLAVLLAGIGVLLAGRVSGVHAVAAASLLPVSLGAAIYLLGVPAAKLLFAPAALLTLALSLYRGMFSSLGFLLQRLTATVSAMLTDSLGVPVRRDGVDLYVRHAHFVVAQTCSGMDSLLALLFLGSLVIILGSAGWVARLIMLASALPIVLATNIIRVTVVLVASGWNGLRLESGVLHAGLSAAVFLCAGSAFTGGAVALRCIGRPRAS